MRNELEEIQRIEKYLSKELNPSELVAFEEELKTNLSLQEKVNQQKILLKGIRKKAFKELAKSTFKKYQFIKKMWWGGIGFGIIALLISVALLVNNKENEEKEPQNTPAIASPTIDSIMKDSVSVVPPATPLVDSIKPEKPILKKKEVNKDTFIETKQSTEKTKNELFMQDEKINQVDIK